MNCCYGGCCSADGRAAAAQGDPALAVKPASCKRFRDHLAPLADGVPTASSTVTVSRAAEIDVPLLRGE
jgi:hypothetical protein